MQFQAELMAELRALREQLAQQQQLIEQLMEDNRRLRTREVVQSRGLAHAHFVQHQPYAVSPSSPSAAAVSSSASSTSPPPARMPDPIAGATDSDLMNEDPGRGVKRPTDAVLSTPEKERLRRGRATSADGARHE